MAKQQHIRVIRTKDNSVKILNRHTKRYYYLCEDTVEQQGLAKLIEDIIRGFGLHAPRDVAKHWKPVDGDVVLMRGN